MTTGGNTSINAATIVDAGSLTTPYVQGTAYSDTILIQTNIIATDSKVVTNDPSKLAPEVVAFTGTDATDHSTDAPQLYAPPPQDSSASPRRPGGHAPLRDSVDPLTQTKQRLP